MIRLSKLADYAIVILSYFVSPEVKTVYTARELADASHLPLPTVSKILKALCRAGLLMSHRGMHGGYSLTRAPEAVSVVDIIGAIEGPIAMTVCSFTAPGLCEFESACPVRSNWQRINQVVVQALSDLSLVAMQQPLSAVSLSYPADPAYPVSLAHLEQRRSMKASGKASEKASGKPPVISLKERKTP